MSLALAYAKILKKYVQDHIEEAYLKANRSLAPSVSQVQAAALTKEVDGLALAINAQEERLRKWKAAMEALKDL